MRCSIVKFSVILRSYVVLNDKFSQFCPILWIGKFDFATFLLVSNFFQTLFKFGDFVLLIWKQIQKVKYHSYLNQTILVCVIIHGVSMKSFIVLRYVEYHYNELSVIMMSTAMLCLILLSVVMMSVVLLSAVMQCGILLGVINGSFTRESDFTLS